jgi:hypothetical protein
VPRANQKIRTIQTGISPARAGTIIPNKKETTQRDRWALFEYEETRRRKTDFRRTASDPRCLHWTNPKNPNWQTHPSRPEQKARRERKLARPLDREARTLGFRGMTMTKLEDTARELGFTIKKGPTKFSGYILKRLNVTKRSAAAKSSNGARKATIDLDDEELQDQIDDEGLGQQVDEFPLGTDFKWSLADIEDYLESHATDVSAGRVKASDDDGAEPEVETSNKVAKVKPPSPQKLAASLRNHADAAEIKAMMKSANVSVPQGPTLQDLIFEERAYQARKRYEAEQAWKTNIDSIRDPMTERERQWELNNFRNPEKDRTAWLASIERENAAFLSPETGDNYAPKPSTGFKVASKGRRKAA